MKIDYLIKELNEYKAEGITEVFIEVCDINDEYGGDTTFDKSATYPEVLAITVNLPIDMTVKIEGEVWIVRK